MRDASHRVFECLIAICVVAAAVGVAQGRAARDLQAKLNDQLSDPSLTPIRKLEVRARCAIEMLRTHIPSSIEAGEELARRAKGIRRSGYASLGLAIAAYGMAKRDGADGSAERMREARALMPQTAPPVVRGYVSVLDCRLQYTLDRYGAAAAALKEAFRIEDVAKSKWLRAECLLALIDLLDITGTGHQRDDDLDHAQELLESLQARRGALRVVVRKAHNLLHRGHEERAKQMLQGVAVKARDVGDLRTRQAALAHLYECAVADQDLAEAIEIATQCVANARELGDLEEIAYALDAIAWANILADTADRAMPALVEAIEIAERMQLPQLLRTVLESGERIALKRRNAEDLLRHSLRLEEISRGLERSEDHNHARTLLRELRGDRRQEQAELAERERRWEAAKAEGDRRATFYRWLAAGVGIALLTLLALVLFVGKRRAEGMHAELRRQTDRAQANEETRKRLEEQVRQIERLESLGMLTAGVAHDFNNILAIILGNAEVLLLETQDGREEITEDIVRAAHRASELCNRMLDFAKPSPTASEVVDLSTVVREAKPLLNAAASDATATIVEPDPSPVWVRLDRSSVEQVLLNLVINAQDSEVGARTVRVRTAAVTGVPGPDDPGHWFGVRPAHDLPVALLEVRDDGAGIAPDLMRRIFDPFFTTKFTGRGLGLSAAYGIVTAHDGGIHVDSTRGRGTRFRVYLPAAHAGASDPVPPPCATAELASVGIRKILVVDDEAAVLTMVSRVLGRDGVTVVTARSGADGLRRIDEHGDTIEALLVDLTMPEMDGRELIERVRVRSLPILVMTGHDESFVRDRLGDLSVCRVLHKPVTAERLREAILAVGSAVR